MAADESDDETAGGTLIEKLRARANKKSAPAPKASAQEEEEDDDEGSFDEDDFLDDDEEDDMYGDEEEDEEMPVVGSKRGRPATKMSAYDRLVAEEQDEAKSKRQLEEERKARNRAEDDAEEGPGRRKIDRRIETHRGETRVRPKDRKTPHLAQRHKYAKGLAKVRSHTKSFKPEPEAGFSGTIRPGIKHSTRL
eukprot:TRINITY_DN14553_c0_g1_i1.p1 TRINITY_DN14553_c0_g1~~TRINITY_DN14553_c0_g1_i1.p1  ORF type:complete len:194 (+),score=84.85 TRINITY_DN14553_c0_g1_i1:94-675(+)